MEMASSSVCDGMGLVQETSGMLVSCLCKGERNCKKSQTKQQNRATANKSITPGMTVDAMAGYSVKMLLKPKTAET